MLKMLYYVMCSLCALLAYRVLMQVYKRGMLSKRRKCIKATAHLKKVVAPWGVWKEEPGEKCARLELQL